MPLANPTPVYDMRSPVLLAQPVFTKVLTLFFGGLLAVGLGFSAVTQYARNETVKGEIAAASGFSAVTVGQGGIISEVAVEPGQKVRKGQVLAVLSLPAVVSGAGDTAAMSVARMRESLGNLDLQLAEYGRTIAQAEAEMREIEASAASSLVSARARGAVTADRQRLAERRLKGFEGLAAKGFVTDYAVDQVRAVSMQIRQEAADTDLQANEIVRAKADRLVSIENRVRDIRQAMLALRTQRLQTENQIHESEALESLRIVSPSDGIVSAIPVRPGQRVESGERIAAVGLASSELTALLEVPSKAIGMIEAGQRVVLKYDAFPYQSFGVRYGRVVRVEQASIEMGKPDPDSEKQGLERHFLVEVRPDDDAVLAYGRLRPLRVGMTLSADVEVERRNLLSWFLSPLVTLKGRFG
jgi:membrane fusion protein